MASSGPRPKSRSLKLIEGNPGKRRIQPELKATPLAPPSPSWLPKEAKEFWAETAPELERVGLLTVLDGPAFTATALTWWLARMAWNEIERDGLFRKDRAHGGQKTKHPAFTVYGMMTGAFRLWAAEFGLTPSARTRFSLPPPEGDDLADLD